jgi:hypothetical protein
MAAKRSLTSANAILLIGIVGLYDAPQQIQGFGTDDAFDVDALENAETAMGVDGKFSAGYVPRERKMSIVLQADSLSNDLFDNWNSASETARTIYWANGQLSIPSIRKKYTLSDGVLTSYKPLPGGKKILQPRTHVITWGRSVASPM